MYLNNLHDYVSSLCSGFLFENFKNDMVNGAMYLNINMYIMLYNTYPYR